MLTHNNFKKYILNFVCMIMLVLIQFDVCGYDLLRAARLADLSTTSYELPSTDLSISDAESLVSEWDNPVYRGVSPRTFLKVPPQELCSILFIPNLRELPYSNSYVQYIQAKLSNLNYLRFCTLLI